MKKDWKVLVMLMIFNIFLIWICDKTFNPHGEKVNPQYLEVIKDGTWRTPNTIWEKDTTYMGVPWKTEPRWIGKILSHESK